VPIYFSAAYQTYPSYPNGLVFFGGANCKGYALRADTGAFVWERQLYGDTLTAWWPVVAQDRVLFAASPNYPTNDNDLRGLQMEVLGEASLLDPGGTGFFPMSHHINWLIQYPHRNTFFVLDAVNGTPQEQSPFLYWGNPGGQRSTASVAPDNKIWLDTPWDGPWSYFGGGKIGGWDKSTAILKYVGNSGYWESSDEPSTHSIIGNYIYFNDGGDGVDKGGVFDRTSGSQLGGWTNATFRAIDSTYYGNWAARKYGSNFRDGLGNTWGYTLGHHGHQNVPTPLNGKVYIHRSNAVICMGP
jgi:hypothetical protein